MHNKKTILYVISELEGERKWKTVHGIIFQSFKATDIVNLFAVLS